MTTKDINLYPPIESTPSNRVSFLLSDKIHLWWGPKAWKIEWLPNWFLEIKNCFHKLSFPSASVRLDYLLYKDFIKRNANFLPNGYKSGMEEVLSRCGIAGVLRNPALAKFTNFKDYGVIAISKDDKTYGRILETDNYGRVVRQEEKNEFEDSSTLAKIACHLDGKLLEWHYNNGWFNDTMEEFYKNNEQTN